MPKIGKRKKLELSLDHVFLFKLSQEILKPPDPDSIQAITRDYLIHNIILNNSRYASDRIQIRKSKEWSEQILPNLRGGRFRQQLRVNRSTFQHLVSLIQGDRVLPPSNYAETCKQLAVTLFRFGRFGNGGSIADVSSRFGISEGSVHVYTHRIIKALNQLRPEYIKWPDLEGMTAISSRMKLNGFPGCVGAVDGTSVPFFDKPLDGPEDYYSRKQEYGMQLQLVFDDNKRIIHMYTGMPASVHDATVFRHSKLVIPVEYFILGESAYANSETLVTPFRKRVGAIPNRERTFNRQLSSVRVIAEHGIGIMKNRFQSLKGLRVRVDKCSGHRRACEWISACCVLYNIIAECDPWNGMEDPENEDEDSLMNTVQNQNTGRREKLVQYIWELSMNGIL